MQNKTLQWKRVLRTALLVLLMSVVGIGKGYAQNYDFSAVCSTGQTLYYKVTDGTNCCVTYPNTFTDFANSHYAWDGYTMPTGRVAIPSTVYHGGITYTVTTISDRAFLVCNGITVVEIPNTITSIGFCAFRNCSALHTVKIPNSLTNIAGSAFFNCNKLDKVLIDDLEAWCNISFANVINDVGLVESNPLSHASKLYLNGQLITNLQIPEGITQIKSFAFLNAKCIKTVVFPNTVTSIGFMAFWNCSDLVSATIPNSLTSIGEKAFYGCGELASVSLPGVVTIGKSAFENCRKLSEVSLSESLEIIRNGAFWGCKSINSITIPSNVKEMENSVFYGCDNLSEVNFNATKCTSDNLWQGFNGCSALTTLTIGDNVQIIPNRFFKSCTSLSSVEIPKSVISVGVEAFSGCTSLQSLAITSDSLTGVGDGAFGGCTRLSEVRVKDIESWCKIRFSNQAANPLYFARNLYVTNELVTDLVIPQGIQTISSRSFENSTITSLTLPSTVTMIEDYAFQKCTNLNVIVSFSAISPTIGTNTFANISSLASLFVPCGSQMAYFSSWGVFDYNNIHEDCTPRSVSIDSNVYGGTITPSVSQASMGQEVMLTVAPNPGMHFSSLNVYNTNNPSQSVPVSHVDNVTNIIYKFNMPAFAVTATATFEHDAAYSISISSNIAGGSITASASSATAGETITLNVHPNSGYELQSLTVCNANDGSQTVAVINNTFIMPSFDVMVSASFNYTSVDENDCISASIHPNPTSSIITIEAESLKHITISNLLGQTIFESKACGDEFTYDLGKHGSGLYLIRIETANGVAVKKVSVAR